MSHRFRTADKNSPAARARAAKYASVQHRQARTHFAALIRQGHGSCWRCGLPIPAHTPSRAWHVGHDDTNPNVIRGPEHARCNLTAAARAGNAAQQARRHPVRRAQSRTW